MSLCCIVKAAGLVSEEEPWYRSRARDRQIPRCFEQQELQSRTSCRNLSLPPQNFISRLIRPQTSDNTIETTRWSFPQMTGVYLTNSIVFYRSTYFPREYFAFRSRNVIQKFCETKICSELTKCRYIIIIMCFQRHIFVTISLMKSKKKSFLNITFLLIIKVVHMLHSQHIQYCYSTDPFAKSINRPALYDELELKFVGAKNRFQFSFH